MLKRVSVESVLVMFLFILFTASIGVLIVEGQGAYEHIIESKNQNENLRIAHSYIQKRIKQNNHMEHIFVIENPYNDHNVLKIDLSGDEEGYFTYIFYDEGKLYEMLAYKDEEPKKELSEVIVELKSAIHFDVDSKRNFVIIKTEGYDNIYVHVLGKEDEDG